MHGTQMAGRKRRAGARAESFAAVYVFEANGAAIKVGRSKNPHARLRTLQTGHDRVIRQVWAVWMSSADAVRVEGECHAYLRKSNLKRGSGEWYYINADAVVAVIRKILAAANVTAWGEDALAEASA